MSDFPWDIGMVYKVITGANHPGLNFFEPQTAVGVLTTSFSSQDIRALESSEGHGKSLSETQSSIYISGPICASGSNTVQALASGAFV